MNFAVSEQKFKSPKNSYDNNNNDTFSILKEFKRHGISALTFLNEISLFSLIQSSDEDYYNTVNTEQVLLSDNEYDILQSYLKERYPTNPYFTSASVGAAPTTNKTKLPVYMGSMNKIKPNETNTIFNWLNIYKGSYIVSCKLDGVSGLYVREIDGTEKLYTRGDGDYGQNISHLLPYLHLPKVPINTQRTIVRGEFIIVKNVFKEKYAADYSNARNMTSGIINRNTIDDKIEDIHFVTYEVIEPVLKPSEQLSFLIDCGYNVVPFFSLEMISNEILTQMLVQSRNNCCYEIDGLIITDDKIYQRKRSNPDYSFAFKMVSTDQIAEATVVDVLWSPSKNGYLKPRIQIKPILIGNVKITFTNGFNAAYILNNKIGPNAKIKLMRSGDVIPHIIDILSPADEPKMPPLNIPYHWTESGIDIVVDNLEENLGVRLKQLSLFFRKIEVEELSEGNIQRIMDAGFDSVQKIIRMTMTDFLSVNGFQEKMAMKIYSGIREKLSQATIDQLMVASNLFARGTSTNKIQLIFDVYPAILTTTVGNEASMIQKVAKIKGVSLQSATVFIETIPIFLQFLDEIVDNVTKTKILSQNKNTNINTNISSHHPLYKKTIVMTGFRDAELVQKIEAVGGILSGTINQKISIVLCKNMNAGNNKLKEASKLNIPVIQVDEFIHAYFQQESFIHI